MALTNEQITAKNLKSFYDHIFPYLGTVPAEGFTPVGTVITVVGTTPPMHYVECNGQTLMVNEYPYLAAYFIEQFGSSNYFGGNGTTTFNVPDLRSNEVSDAMFCIAVQNTFIDVDIQANRDLQFTVPRWLRFDPDNRKGLTIKAGTFIRLANGTIKRFGVDTKVDLTSQISAVGADYFLFIANDGTFNCVTDKSSGTGVYIGRFHTLCANAGTITMISPASPSSGITVGSNYLVKPYRADQDLDFYNFYNKQVTAVSAGTPYDVITTQHPLSGFTAGDILPESVFCLSWQPDCLFEDAMVYDVVNNICVDVYLQSGTGINTRSRYNQTHTVSRQQINHLSDFMQVGKRLLTDQEFTSVALGSNERTNIQGSADKTTVGGHVDTAGRRMISAIGCEETCGYLWQWLSDLIFVSNASPNNAWCSIDGKDSFGQQYWNTHALHAGGSWADGASCGSRCRSSPDVRSYVSAAYGSRGAGAMLNKI